MATQKGHTFNVGRNRTSLNLIVSSSTRGSEPKLWFGNLADPVEQRGMRPQDPVFVGCNHSRLLLVTGCSSTAFRQCRQSAWLLFFCAVSRATTCLRVCRPSVAKFVARQHDADGPAFNLFGPVPLLANPLWASLTCLGPCFGQT